MINKEKFIEFCKLMRKYNEYCSKYVDAEISLELDEIAGGIISQLLEELFNAWFPELKELDYTDSSGYCYHGYEIFDTLWYNSVNNEAEELYNYLKKIMAEAWYQQESRED